MSQIYKSSSGGTLPPTVATSYLTENGMAVPSGNVLKVYADTTSSDFTAGITTQASPNLGDTLEVVLTNRLTGTATSINGSTEQLISFALGGSAAVFRFDFSVTGRDTGSGDGVGYTVFGSAKTDGTTATVIATPFIDNDEDSSLLTSSVSFTAASNTVNLNVTGVTGRTINYKSVATYVVV
jgi:hypothetical protein